MFTTARAPWRALMSLVVAAAIIGGCASGDDDSDNRQDDPGPAASATARAENRPEYRDGAVYSGALGYSADLPERWNILPTADIAQGQQDSFATPQDDTIPTFIIVRCLRGDELSVQSQVDVLKRAFPEATPGTRTVDGNAGASLSYLAGAAATQVEREDVIFQTDRCLWMLSLVTPPGQRAERSAVFEQFLTTFRPTP